MIIPIDDPLENKILRSERDKCQHFCSFHCHHLPQPNFFIPPSANSIPPSTAVDPTPFVSVPKLSSSLHFSLQSFSRKLPFLFHSM